MHWYPPPDHPTPPTHTNSKQPISQPFLEGFSWNFAWWLSSWKGSSLQPKQVILLPCSFSSSFQMVSHTSVWSHIQLCLVHPDMVGQMHQRLSHSLSHWNDPRKNSSIHLIVMCSVHVTKAVAYCACISTCFSNMGAGDYWKIPIFFFFFFEPFPKLKNGPIINHKGTVAIIFAIGRFVFKRL